MQNDQADRDDLLEELVDAQLLPEQLQLEFRDWIYNEMLDEKMWALEERVTQDQEATTEGGPDE
ncbi:MULTISPECIES: hypothetical protein [unclassified Natrinema]|uniref:hypothetical protein n=1 Tax=unclassified Natrinema TaxID=2622230 RepID=UPI00026D47D6|nr:MULTISPECIES: hypothetical protein [unclassified Natrinema]AFO59125.1 hypothetical protein NJ7G_3908 [Natrinema sp. J7-2]